MSSESNNRGRAYEYICLCSLKSEIEKYRKVQIEKNSSFEAAERAWNLIDEDLQNMPKICIYFNFIFIRRYFKSNAIIYI